MFRFYTNTSKKDEIKESSFWQNQLIQAGCDEELIKKIIQTKAIQNYKHLYQVVERYNSSSLTLEYNHNIHEVWELLCFSGEPQAIQYAMEHEQLTAETKNKFGETGFHLACRSGFSMGIEASLLLKDSKGNNIDPLIKTKSGNTGFSCACWSGSPKAIDKSLELKNAKGEHIDPLDKTDRKLTGFHWACLSGSPLAMEKSLNAKNIKGQKLNFLDTTFAGATGFHFACMSGSLAAIKNSLKLKNSRGERIDPYEKTYNRETGLHLASKSGSLAAVIFLRHKLNLDPLEQDDHGNDAFWRAEQSDNPSLIKSALLTPLSINLEEETECEEPQYKKYKL
jgi:ankyrin repeat protein